MTETQGGDVGPRPRSLDDVPPDILFATMPLTVSEVIDQIARFYDVPPATLRLEKGSKPKGKRGHARELICFFLYRLKKGSFRWIGNRLGYADGSGPKQAEARIAKRAANEQQMRDEITMIERRLAAYLRKRGVSCIDE